MIIVIFCVPSKVRVSTTITECEQVIECPSSLKNNSITFSTTGGNATAYLVEKEPQTTGKGSTQLIEKGDTVKYGDYSFKSFNLVKQSTLSWSLTGTREFTFYLVQGENQFNKFVNYDDFKYLKSMERDHVDGKYTVSESDEYFAIIDASYDDTRIDSYYNVTHTRYDLSTFISKSSESTTFDVDSSYVPGVCIIVDMPCGDKSSSDIVIEYTKGKTVLFYVCVSVAAAAGLAMIISIILCIVCIFKKRVGTQGSTYQTVPPVAPAPAPVPSSYPSGGYSPYQQTQPSVPYNPAAPDPMTQPYPTSTGYEPSAPSINADYNTYGITPAY